MGGAILQLVSNSGAPQNYWLDHNPQITFFKKIYRRPTPFSIETIPLQFKTPIDFGKIGNITILPDGDLVHRIFLVFDIPKLAAMFLNTKSMDIEKIIGNMNTNDKILLQNLKKCVYEGQVEYDRLFNLIDETFEKYDREEEIRLNILNLLEKFKDADGVNGIEQNNDKKNFYHLGLENELYIMSEIKPNNTEYDYFKFKTELSEQWIGQKKDYYLIYEFLKLIYLSNKNIMENIPLSNGNDLIDILIYSNIFDELLQSKEILFMHYLDNLNIDKNNLTDICSKLEHEYQKMSKNMHKYQNFNRFYKISKNYQIMKATIIDHSADHPKNFDQYHLLEKMLRSENNYQNDFYDFGPNFHYMLNSYNTIISVLNNMAKTVPIICIKPLIFSSDQQHNIYQDLISHNLDDTYLATIIDPNFRAKFLLEINNPEKNIIDNNFMPFDLNNTFDYMHPNLYINSYLELFNGQANITIDKIKKNIDMLFEKYRSKLFDTTDKLFFNNSPSLTNIYSYIVPTKNFHDNEELRISNVFNANIWFFYFFKYLDQLNENSFTNYVKNNIIISISKNGVKFMENLITLLKINIEYYMNEIGYLLNDLYASCPSTNPSDNMKNYVPIANSTMTNGINNKNDLMAVTLIFHRNHVPSILEMFQYIYHFISIMEPAKINSYLDIDIPEIEYGELARIREIIKLFYYQIFGYFMNVYDDFCFEPSANFSTNEFNEYDNNAINKYVQYFLNSDPFDSSIKDNYPQRTLSKTISQMEFYFVAEMINMRELQKLYHNILFNQQLITESVGSTTGKIIGLIVDEFIKINNNNINTSNFKTDKVRNYWDELYRSNINNGILDKLYYSTFNPDRYNGDSYINTAYCSRNYGIVSNNLPLSAPIPLPSTNPYGINPQFYDHNQILMDFTPYPTSNENILKTEISVCWIPNKFENNIYQNYNAVKNTKSIQSIQSIQYNTFETYDIDFFRIKHSTFHNSENSFLEIDNFIDEYQFNLLKFMKLAERLNNIYPIYDKYLLNWLSNIIFYLIKYSDPNLLFNGSMQNSSLLKLSHILNVYLTSIESSIENEKLTFPQKLSQEMFQTAYQMVEEYDNNSILKCSNNQKLYTIDDLIANNEYVHGQMFNKNSTNNIIEKIINLRNNFLSQYYYYVKHKHQINNIYSIGKHNKLHNFMNMGEIMHKIINLSNNNTLFNEVSPNLLLYPDLFPDSITELFSVQNNLDDFSQAIIKLLVTFFVPNSVPRFTFKDIFDIINITFESVREIYRYLVEKKQIDFINKKLAIYQPLLLNKMTLYDKICKYIKNIPKNKYMEEIDVFNIAELARQCGINYDDYSNYIKNTIGPQYNSAKYLKKWDYIDFILLNMTLYNDLDHYFLKKYVGCQEYTSFKNCIISDIFTPEYLKEHAQLQKHFNYIDNEYYSFIYFFINYVQKHDLDSNQIKNPLLSYDQINLVSDQNHISKYYNSFSKFGDVLQYFMDYLWDYTMTITDQKPNTNNIFDYENRFSLFLNELHLDKKFNTLNKDIDYSSDDNRIKNIINVLNDPNFKSNFIEKNNSNFWIDLHEKSKIIETLKDIAKKGLVVLNAQKKELVYIKNQIRNVMYRNKKAKCAWIRKLGHFIVEHATIKFSDQIGDHHISDWFEVYHEISKHENKEYGYNKMIGNLPDLTIFDNKTKNSYTITVPLIFYFNKNIALSLPLNASINTKYDISIKLRSLNDVTYKEEFSDFINPDLIENTPYIPSINKAHLMVEYIYLSTEERKIFASNRLEYLIEELQYDYFNISDKNLLSIYKIGNTKKTVTKIKNGAKIKEEYYNQYKGTYVEENNLNISKNNNLIPRNDYLMEKYTDRTGITKTIMIYKPLANIDPYIHFKRIELKNHFNHPSEILVVLIKPLVHIDPSYRTDEKNYFYGEKQWDNYGLYSHYNLEKILEAKQNYYDQIKTKLNDLEDPEFGIIAIINQLLLEYVDLSDKKSDNKIEKWIHSNYSYFLEILHKMKDIYNSYHDQIIYAPNVIKLKEFLLSLKIDYHVIDYDTLQNIIDHVFKILNINHINNHNIDQIFKNDTDIYITKNKLVNHLINLLSKQIGNNIITENKIIDAVKIAYDDYNESQINQLIYCMSKEININNNAYSLPNLISYFYNFYLTNSDRDKNITNIISMLPLAGLTWDNIMTKNSTFKDVIYQIINNLQEKFPNEYSQIPSNIFDIICYKMTQKLNEIINNYPVDLIDYQKNMILNPKINPLISGHLKFNSYNIMPENSTNIIWSEAQSYQYFNHTPNIGINLYSWSLKPLLDQHMGSTNLSKIDDFSSVYNIHPLIGDSNPAIIVSMIVNINIMRYLSGMCGKAWE